MFKVVLLIVVSLEFKLTILFKKFQITGLDPYLTEFTRIYEFHVVYLS